MTSYRFETSDDGSTWTARSEGSFGNMTNNPVRQDIKFPEVKARWFRFTGLADTSGGNTIRAAEISVIAGGFDAWKRDRGLQSLLPDDMLGGAPALASYFLGSSGGVRRASLPAAGNLHLELVSRGGIPDIGVRFEVSDNLSHWTAAEDVSLVSTENLPEEREANLWSMSIPQATGRGFARAVYALK